MALRSKERAKDIGKNTKEFITGWIEMVKYLIEMFKILAFYTVL